ncbi:Uma2 family endonuclease [Paractinoplanes ovalisporus]|nr:Uma2 family endonuclease [Actinoplanes ovalisporus]
MTEVNLDRPEPWTEAEFLALDRHANRIELIDGGLWVSPGPNVPHQGISYLLHTALRPAARSANLKTFEAVNLRLQTNRILVPDLVVVDWSVRLGTVVEPADVTLVAEIVSPSTGRMDRFAKSDLYAAAKIDWYLLVEPEMPDYQGVTLRLLRRRNSRYVEEAVAKPGEELLAHEPFPITIRTTELVEF